MTQMTFDDIMAVYAGSDGEATKGLYLHLGEQGPRGLVAVKLLQACKASERAKLYTRGKWRAVAYDKKDWAIGELCRSMALSFPDVIESWGWGFDAKSIGFEHVLYCDVPGAGQVSFHTSHRRDGPDYAGAWDGIRGDAARRICLWAEAVLHGRELSPIEPEGETNVPAPRAEGTSVASAPSEQVQGQEAFDF